MSAHHVVTTYRCMEKTPIGRGAFASVFKAISEDSSRVIAYKKSRVSLRVQRTTLRHEARVLQHLAGHPTIPKLIGYRRAEHFEFLGMQLLGKDVRTLIQPGHALKPETVARIGEQMLSAIQHMHCRGMVHRDVKPENILLCPSDPSRVQLIDFGIARYLGSNIDVAPRKTYDPLKENRHVIGTLNWCSRNSHSGIELRTQDDVESLAFTLFFLALGNVPWRRDDRSESMKHAMERVETTKRQFVTTLPVSGISPCFSDILKLVDTPSNELTTAITAQRESLRALSANMGIKDTDALDLTSIPAPASCLDISTVYDESDSNQDDTQDDDDDDDEDHEKNEEYSNSYFEWDIADWDIQGGRDLTLTFPSHDAERLDGEIPELVQILDE